MNTALLNRVAERILAEPLRHSTTHYISGGTLRELREGAPQVSADIAGWALALTPNAHEYLHGGERPDWVRSACVALDLPMERARLLLCKGHWPQELRERLDAAWPGREEAEVTADAIRWFIESEGVKRNEKS